MYRFDRFTLDLVRGAQTVTVHLAVAGDHNALNAAGAAAMAKNAAQRGTNSPFSMPSTPATRCIFWESIQMW